MVVGTSIVSFKFITANNKNEPKALKLPRLIFIVSLKNRVPTDVRVSRHS